MRRATNGRHRAQDGPDAATRTARRDPARARSPGTRRLLGLQRTVGNRAVAALMLPQGPAVQRCGTVPPDQCDCHGDTAGPPAGLSAALRRPARASLLQRLTEAERRIDLTAPGLAGDPTLEAAFDNDPPLRAGDSGEPVKKIQRGLMDDGHVMPRSTGPGGPDGIYGSETVRAVRAFQRRHGLDVDGVVGRQTLGKLDELSNATGGVGRGGGSRVRVGDTGFEIRGKHPGAARQPNKIFFEESSATVDSDEDAKLAALAAPPDRVLTLRGVRSEDEDAALATSRIAAVSARLAAHGHTAARNADPRPAAGEGRLVYRAVRAVEIIPAGGTPSVPDCSGGPAVPTPAPNAFTTANTRALAMLDAALAKLAVPTPEARTMVAALFRRAGALPAVRSRLRALRRHLAGWTAPSEHRFHNECDGSCVGTIAYAEGAARPLTLCPIFMNEPDLDERAGTLIHEGTHREPALDTSDHAYLFERVIAHLSAPEALDNADSYLALVRNLEAPGSVAVGPSTPDTPGGGITDPGEVAAVEEAIAFAEKWLSANDSELGSLYSVIVESRPAGTWTNGYYEDTMRPVARLFGFTSPPALPTSAEQQAIAGIADRVSRMGSFFAGSIAFDRASDATDPVAVGPGRRITVGDAFFRATPTERVHQLITTIVQKMSTVPVDQQPKYQVMIEQLRRHFDAPAP